MKVKDCMCGNVCSCTQDDSISNVAKIMQTKHIGCVPVCNNSKEVVGILTDRDIILRTVACGKDTNILTAKDVMTRNVCCCTPDSDLTEAVNLMSTEKIKRIPVIQDNKIVGILTLGDLAENKEITEKCLCNTLENICDCHTNKNNE